MPREYRFYVYIMGSITGTLYTGVCNDIFERVMAHKSGQGSEFTRRYKCDRLVYYESHQYVRVAIRREKEIKGWKRYKKIALIESINPSWKDLAKDWGKPVASLVAKSAG
jgi:putative endonuclease